MLKTYVLKRASSVPHHMTTEDVGRLEAANIHAMTNHNDEEVHMNSDVGVKCSNVIGERSTMHVIPLANIYSTNTGAIPGRDLNDNFPQGNLDDVEVNFRHGMVDTDRPTPILLVPNVHYLSSQLESNEVKDVSDPF